MKKRKPIEYRFWSKVDLDFKTGCWIWTGTKSKSGYGQISMNHSITIRIHRFSYELFKGKISEGLVIDHLCRNKLCVNPNHLETVTIGENTRRGDAKFYWLLKTHCPQGHPYNSDNLYIRPTGGRFCRECGRLRDKIKYQRKHKKE